MSVKGSCLCGAVTYEITGPFEYVGNCHCSICRKSHGAAFANRSISAGSRAKTSFNATNPLPEQQGASASDAAHRWPVYIPE
jgi:hypothetical protein